jgi:hypothetical protein
MQLQVEPHQLQGEPSYLQGDPPHQLLDKPSRINEPLWLQGELLVPSSKKVEKLVISFMDFSGTLPFGIPWNSMEFHGI